MLPSPTDSGRIVFFGYGELGLAGFEVLRRAGARVAAVVIPGNRSGTAVDGLRDAAGQQGVPVLTQPHRSGAGAFVASLDAMRPDLIIVWSYSMILSPAVLALPPLGAVNVHGGLLPQYRGGHVTQWAIITGEAEFGVTLHYIDAGIDTGPVIAEQRFALSEADDAFTVREKIREAGGALLTAWLPRLLDGTAPRVPQDQSRARYWPMRSPAEGLITWSMPAAAICRLVRALSANMPGAYVEAGGRRISIRRASAHPRLDVGVPAGRVVAVDGSGVRVAAADGDVVITAAEDADGTPMDPVTAGELFRHAAR